MDKLDIGTINGITIPIKSGDIHIFKLNGKIKFIYKDGKWVNK